MKAMTVWRKVLALGRHGAIAALVSGSLGAAAGEFPALPTPAQSALSSLGDRLRVNGQEARLFEMSFPGTVDDLLAFYRVKFERSVSEPKGINGQRVIGGLVGDSHVTVQVPKGSNQPVYARVLQTKLVSRGGRTTGQAPWGAMPVDSKPLSQVESQDGDRSSRITVYANRHSVAANLDFAQQALARKGLAPVDRPVRDARDVAVWFSGAQGAEALLTVRSVGEHRVVTLNEVSRLAAYEGAAP